MGIPSVKEFCPVLPSMSLSAFSGQQEISPKDHYARWQKTPSKRWSQKWTGGTVLAVLGVPILWLLTAPAPTCAQDKDRHPGPACDPIIVPAAPCAAAQALRHLLEELHRQLSGAKTPEEIQAIQTRIICVQREFEVYEEQCRHVEPPPAGPRPPMDNEFPMECPPPEQLARVRENPCTVIAWLEQQIAELRRQLATLPPPGTPMTGYHELLVSRLQRALECHLKILEEIRRGGMGSRCSESAPNPMPQPPPPPEDMPVPCPSPELSALLSRMETDPCEVMTRIQMAIDDMWRRLQSMPPSGTPMTGVQAMQRSILERTLDCYQKVLNHLRNTSGDKCLERSLGGGPGVVSRTPAMSAMCQDLIRKLNELKQRKPNAFTQDDRQLRELEERIRNFCSRQP